jgi:hypothetical protein
VELILSGREVFTRRQIEFPLLILIYMCACSGGGAILGLLLPLARWKSGSMLLGFLAILPIGFVIRYVTLADSAWSRSDGISLLIGALGIGLPSGAIYHQIFSEALGVKRKSDSPH